MYSIQFIRLSVLRCFCQYCLLAEVAKNTQIRLGVSQTRLFSKNKYFVFGRFLVIPSKRLICQNCITMGALWNDVIMLIQMCQLWLCLMSMHETTSKNWQEQLTAYSIKPLCLCFVGVQDRFHPGSLTPSTDAKTLLDLAKQAARIHCVSQLQVFFTRIYISIPFI